MITSHENRELPIKYEADFLVFMRNKELVRGNYSTVKFESSVARGGTN